MAIAGLSGVYVYKALLHRGEHTSPSRIPETPNRAPPLKYAVPTPIISKSINTPRSPRRLLDERHSGELQRNDLKLVRRLWAGSPIALPAELESGKDGELRPGWA